MDFLFMQFVECDKQQMSGFMTDDLRSTSNLEISFC